MSNMNSERILSVHHWNDTLFSFKCTRDPGLRFENGQFVMIGLQQPNGRPLMRAYSIASPAWDEELEFFSIKVPNGPLTSHLQAIKPGDTVLMRKKPTGTPVLDALTPGRRLYMFSTGTGIAPFRAFLQERHATHAPGPAWLFFGHQRRATDFLYEAELGLLQTGGTLTRLSLAWSRDGDKKVYVQDRMREDGAELFAWLEAGAHFYICGDAKRMAKDVETALCEIVAQHGKVAAEDARAYVAALKKVGRYQADVY